MWSFQPNENDEDRFISGRPLFQRPTGDWSQRLRQQQRLKDHQKRSTDETIFETRWRRRRDSQLCGLHNVQFKQSPDKQQQRQQQLHVLQELQRPECQEQRDHADRSLVADRFSFVQQKK